MSALLHGTPAEDGFVMPGEFEPQSRCYLIWPERPDNWRFGGKPAQEAFGAVASAIAEHEDVTVLASARQWEHARASLPPGVRVVETTTDDAWARDTGPTFVVDRRGGRRGVDWGFNAWGGLAGGLYFPWANDEAVAAKVCELEGVERYRAPFVLEGGSVHVDGQGTCLTTEECLLNPNRNPERTKADIERLLEAYLGVECVIWLPRGLDGDETDGHVDNLACFSAPGRVLLSWPGGDAAPGPQADARRLLEAASDARGRPLEVSLLVEPPPMARTAAEAAGVDRTLVAEPRAAGDPLTASYVNCFIGNGAVVYPQFDPAHDEAAAEVLAAHFPGRALHGVAAREILLGGGGIHCITQQVPAV